MTRLEDLEGFLRWLEPKQQEALAVVRKNGFVWEELGAEPGNWSHLAFYLYSELCEIDLHVRHLLEEDE